MSGSRIPLQPGILLARRNYRETSLLLEAFSREQGRVGLVAKGVRGGRAGRSALLQPLRPLLLSWTAGAELGTLTGVEAAGQAPELRGEPLFCAWYLNELLLALLPRQDAHPALYDAYASTIERLAAEPPAPLLRAFELRLLAELGYGLPLDEPLDPAFRYDYARESGFHRVSDGGYGGATLIALRDGALGQADALTLTEARTLLREFLEPLLGGRELQTPRLLRELRAQYAVNAKT